MAFVNRESEAAAMVAFEPWRERGFLPELTSPATGVTLQ